MSFTSILLQINIYLIILVFAGLVTSHARNAALDLNDFDYDISDTYIQQRPPYKMDPPYRNPYIPVRKESHGKKKPHHAANTVDSMCVRNLKKKKAEEERENPPKKVVISGNRWHGPVLYGEYKWKSKKQEGHSTKIRAILAVERKLHKCYKWVE